MSKYWFSNATPSKHKDFSIGGRMENSDIKMMNPKSKI